jgi:hypothetical protein
MMRCAIWVSGIEGDFYAVFDRDPDPHRFICVGAEVPHGVDEPAKNEQLPVLVEVVELGNDEKVTPLASVVRFYRRNKVYPRRTNARYLSLFNGFVECRLGFVDWEVDATQNGRCLIPNSGSVCDVVKCASEIVEGVPYRAYEGLGDGGFIPQELRFLRACRIRIKNHTLAIIPQEGQDAALYVCDVLVGPLEFLPSARYIVQG